MAFAVLSPLAQTRELAGVHYLLFPENVALPVACPAPAAGSRPAAVRQSTRQPGGQPPRQSAGQRPQWQRQQPAPRRTTGAAGPQEGAGSKSEARQDNRQGYSPGATPSQGSYATRYQARQQGTAGHAPQPAVRDRGPAAASSTVSAAGLSPASPAEVTASWPAPWQELFQRTPKGRVAWTYYGLGFDLCGYPSRERSLRLRELIRYLSLPQGTHTFWPMGLPVRDPEGSVILEPNREIFWQGVHLLGARVLIVMGSPAARGIGVTGPIRPLLPQAFNGVRMLITWDIDLLDNTTYFNNTQTFLQQMLTSLL